jgi:hypothetical protein
MAIDTRALFRYFIINQRLRKEPMPSTDELRIYVAKELSGATNEIFNYTILALKNDIKAMKKIFNAPISFSFQKNRYEYNTNLQFMELPQLASDYFCNFLRYKFVIGNDAYQKEIISYTDRALVGNEYLMVFAKAILESKQISFAYRPFNSKRSWNVTVSPHFIKEGRFAWFLIADKDGEERTFALHRVETEPIILDTPINTQEIGSQSTSEILNNYETRILLDAVPLLRNALIENPIHKTQQVVWNNINGLRISVQLIPDEQFLSKILSYGGKLKLISPEKLRSKFADLIQSVLDDYSGFNA